VKKFILAVLLLACIFSTACRRDDPDDIADEGQAHTQIGGGSGVGSYDSGTGMAPIRLMVPGTALESDPLGIQLAAQFNLGITFAAYPASFDEMLNALTAADSRPDMFLIALNPSRLNRLANERIIRGIPDDMLAQFPRLNTIVAADPLSQANRRIYGAVGYIPCVHDINPAYSADGGRIIYRKDWADFLNIASMETADDIYTAARTFAGEANPNRTDGTALIGIAVDKPARFAYLYGLDPTGWVLEGDRYVPAFFSDSMLQPLMFARRMYTEGLLTFSDRVTLNDAGIIITNAATAEQLEQIINPVARSLRTNADQVLANHIAILPPPSVWGTNYRTEGWLAQESLPDGILVRFLELLEYSVSQEGLDYRRYGFLDETFTRQGSGVHLFTDPMTFRAYDLHQMYPTGQFLLSFLSRDASRDADLFYPSPVSVSARRATALATLQYYRPFNATDALCRAVYSPSKDALDMDYNHWFYTIITGDEPVPDMFRQFKDECINHGMENVIREVNQAVRRVP
jgi:hypothetical protein